MTRRWRRRRPASGTLPASTLHDLPAQGSDLLRYAARIFIPHQTTASAIRMQVAVRAFSKADEAIAVLSFAYPGETLGDSTGEPQLGKG
jgi:hypothetical protein